MNIQTVIRATPDLAAVKIRQQAAWSSGDYAVVGTTLQIVGERLCEALDLRAGQRVLDVAAGNGNASLAAARRWCRGRLDRLRSALLERGRARARPRTGYRLPRSRCGDAAVRGRELRCRPLHLRRHVHGRSGSRRRGTAPRLQAGGKIGMANWTPQGFIGQLFKTLGAYLPPPAGVKSPALWGTSERLKELFGKQAASIATEPRDFVFRYRSPAHFTDVFSTYYGPVLKALAALPEDKRGALISDFGR